MKRILVLLLACVLVFSIMVSISACKPKKPDTNEPGNDGPGTETPEDVIDKSQIENEDGIQLPVIPLEPSSPDTETEGEGTEG